VSQRIAIVLFNLGGPDSLEAVQPFLRNLFSDPAIIRLPNPFRALLAALISRRRAPVSREMYRQLGGASPLLRETTAQARALELALGEGAKAFIAMRYWHPMSEETARAVKEFAPDRIVLLPLYPQFSTTTTASSLAAWEKAARTVGLNAPTVAMCCYPTQTNWAVAQAERIRAAIDELGQRPRVLFSAHGLPEKVVADGDPYQWQVEQGAAAIAARLAPDSCESVVCYQSRVGPLKWIGPETVDEIRRAGRDGMPVIVVPIAFVSEHSETLVELDIEYRHVAKASGVPRYVRIPTLTADSGFIGGLAGLVRQAIGANRPLTCDGGGRLCPAGFAGCPNR
jgi:protoporphyrin/coproporphyrin ferrochelatase